MTTTITSLKPTRDPLTRRSGLPRKCPSWCVGSHQQALDEGCTVEDARVHISQDFGIHLPTLTTACTGVVSREGGGGLRVELREDHQPSMRSRPTIEVEAYAARPEDEAGSRGHVRLSITTSEARTLAAHLLYLADAEELHAYDNR